jgi:hypothetical protein
VAGQAFGWDGLGLGPRPSLEHVEHRHAHRLLQGRVALDLDVASLPEAVEVLLLLRGELVPAGELRHTERGVHLVPQGGGGSPARPAVREQLHQAETLPVFEAAGDRQPGQVFLHLHGVHGVGRKIE